MFHDRTEVGKLLAAKIRKLDMISPTVLAIPRGGLPVAKEIALALKAPLDLVITRKIGAPGEPEFAIGAVTQEGEVIVDKDVLRSLGISDAYVKDESVRQVKEIKERMRKYRGDRPYPSLAGKTAIIVDDGVATGNTVLAAIESVKRKKPAGIILAIGVAPPETVSKLSKVVDKVVCLDTPEPFYAIGEFYEHFEQVEDEEAKRILSEVNRENRSQ
jgi:putative phosphoribosyl transferase